MKRSKVLLTLLCAVALVATSAFGTMAYLTDKDADVNTFTVGQVHIRLDEADVDDSTPEKDRDQENQYDNILPGHSYVKDPTVTVLEDSVKSYIRMKVTVSNMTALKKAFPVEDYPTFYNGDLFLLQMLVEGWDKDVWEYEGYDVNKGTYEFRYFETVTAPDDNDFTKDSSVVLDALFDKVVIPGAMTNEQIAHLEGIQINVVAHAIQADGFDTADLAWAAFDQQNPNL